MGVQQLLEGPEQQSLSEKAHKLLKLWKWLQECLVTDCTVKCVFLRSCGLAQGARRCGRMSIEQVAMLVWRGS